MGSENLYGLVIRPGSLYRRGEWPGSLNLVTWESMYTENDWQSIRGGERPESLSLVS